MEKKQSKLTDRQEKFAQLVASGKTQSDAYRGAYNCANWKPDTIWAKSSALAAHDKVKIRIESLKKAVADKHLWKREDSIRVLKDVIADEKSRSNDRTGAVKELNLMHGYNAPVEVHHKHSGSIEHVLDRIKSRHEGK